MIVKDVIDFLNDYAPLAYAEEFDNAGLIVGNENNKITGILICHDSIPDVIDEAIKLGYNLIVSFHPILFKGFKNLLPNNYVNNSLIKAVKNDISIFSFHTALDNSKYGVNMQLCKELGIKNTEILYPKKGTIKKLTTYMPKENAKLLKHELFKTGAGNIGKYENCSFSYEGLGTFKGNSESKPYVGEKLKDSTQEEVCINITYLKHLEKRVLKSLEEFHPYEEIAYEIKELDNYNKNIGMGMYGKLTNVLDEKDFLSFLKKTLKIKLLKHSKPLNRKIKKIAVLAGSGSFGIKKAISVSADAYLTADLKYHDYFKAEKSILLVDIGHYESERFTKELIFNYLKKKIPKFACIIAKTNTNPVNYF